MDGGANLLDRDLDAVNTVDIPAVNQGYGMPIQNSVSRALFKKVTYTSGKQNIESGGVFEFTKKLNTIAGYTPVGIVETNTNHDWSFVLMRATINTDGTFTTTWMNLNKNTWNGSIGYVTVLYLRS